jgi:hypothetical protein
MLVAAEVGAQLVGSRGCGGWGVRTFWFGHGVNYRRRRGSFAGVVRAMDSGRVTRFFEMQQVSSRCAGIASQQVSPGFLQGMSGGIDMGFGKDTLTGGAG